MHTSIIYDSIYLPYNHHLVLAAQINNTQCSHGLMVPSPAFLVAWLSSSSRLPRKKGFVGTYSPEDLHIQTSFSEASILTVPCQLGPCPYSTEGTHTERHSTLPFGFWLSCLFTWGAWQTSRAPGPLWLCSPGPAWGSGGSPTSSVPSLSHLRGSC